MKSKLLVGLILALAVLTVGAATSGTAAETNATCHGQTFNPMSDPDWNFLYPVTIMGARTGNQLGVPYHYEPPVCVCPGPFGIPSYGVGITYWEPLFVSEIERTPGCMPTVGGSNVLGSSYQRLASETTGGMESGQQSSNRLQVHWYEYPVFGMMDMFKDSGCKTNTGFNLMWMSEVDYMWQDDSWGNVLNPESALFVSPLAQAACAIDCVATTLAFPLDPLFWCAGCWGSVYPLTGNANVGNSDFQRNNLAQAKFLARQHRLGLMMQTIGPTALCFTHPNPIWPKSQYRVNQVGPTPLRAPSFKSTTIGDAAILSVSSFFGATGAGGSADAGSSDAGGSAGAGSSDAGGSTDTQSGGSSQAGGSSDAATTNQGASIGRAFESLPTANRPTREHTQNLIWQAIQCCDRAY